MVSEKLDQLQKMLEREPRDPFLLYGMGMEYKKLGELPQAIEHFSRVIEIDPNYCYAYYQRAQVFEQLGDIEAAKASYRAGVESADRAKDAHARSELETALAMIE